MFCKWYFFLFYNLQKNIDKTFISQNLNNPCLESEVRLSDNEKNNKCDNKGHVTSISYNNNKMFNKNNPNDNCKSNNIFLPYYEG